jgi:hypothetical protein
MVNFRIPVVVQITFYVFILGNPCLLRENRVLNISKSFGHRFFKPTAVPVSCQPVWRKNSVRLKFSKGVFLEVLEPYELRILTSHFEEATGAKIFPLLCSFKGQ